MRFPTEQVSFELVFDRRKKRWFCWAGQRMQDGGSVASLLWSDWGQEWGNSGTEPSACIKPAATHEEHRSHTQTHSLIDRRTAPEAWAGEENGRYISTFSLDSWRGQKGHDILSVVSFNEFGSTGCIPPQPISEQILSTTCGREGADSGPNPTFGI